MAEEEPAGLAASLEQAKTAGPVGKCFQKVDSRSGKERWRSRALHGGEHGAWHCPQMVSTTVVPREPRGAGHREGGKEGRGLE